MATFQELIEDKNILSTLETIGFTEPTPIQQEAIPHILKGSDIRACSRTGSGKSAAFLLPALLRLKQARERRVAKILVLAPTRELAIQLGAEARRLGQSLKLAAVLLYGGVPYGRQFKDLARPHDIIIATPGRLIDHIDQKRVRLDQVELFVLDEADRMLDMGFIGPVEKIAAKLPAGRQTVMFTATFGKQVKKLSEKLLKNPIEVATQTAEDRHAHIEQRFVSTEGMKEKHRALTKILTEEKIDQAIIFSSTKRQVRRMADELRKRGLSVGALHGDLNQRQRTQTINLFREGKLKLLVATDVAGRGIDVQAVSHVINFDLPKTVDDYTHRIGRTGRAGSRGIAVSFFAPHDRALRKAIEKKSRPA